MKKIAITTILMSGFILIAACKKKGCTDSTAINYDINAKKDDGSCVYPTTPPAQTPIQILTGNFNFIDRGQQFNYTGLSDYAPHQTTYGGYILAGDSVWKMEVKEANTERWLTIMLQTSGGTGIVAGTYNFNVPESQHRIIVQTSKSGENTHTFSNLSGGNVLYQGTPSTNIGQIVLTEVTATKIVGTFHGNLYGDYDAGTGSMTSKLEITSGSFNCPIKRY